MITKEELRSMAVSVGLEVPQAATLMMEAADTIWELRGSVHRERAEADRLRERITTQKQTIQSYRDESREWREVADHAQAENDKLRELAQRADRLLTGLFPYIDYSRCTALEAVAAWRVRARELGVVTSE